MPVKILDNITVGEHGGKVLRELGYSDDEITALQNEMITRVAT
jgi:crotonobetainyl-CoA:carnitine CoA-transferase CaiB-like acyl-CoA transferase